MIHLREVILFVHILLGIVWFGGILFVGWGGYPAAGKLPVREQRLFLYTMLKHSHLLFTLAGIGVIATGIMLGTALGSLHSWTMVTSTHYGQLFLLAGGIATFALLWGVMVSYSYTMHLLKNDQLWRYAARGGIKPLRDAMRRTMLISGIEVIGLLIVVWIMVFI
jgi:putative copper export protein